MPSPDLADAIQELPHQEQLPLELLSRDRLADPWPWFRTMRRTRPVRYDSDRECWDVFRYEDVRRVLTDVESFRRRSLGEDRDGWDEQMASLFPYTNDRSEFDRLYAPLKPFLEDQARLAGYESVIARITRTRIQEVLDEGSQFDFVTEFAEPITLTVMAELLGVPEADQPMVREWINGLIPEPPLATLDDPSEFAEAVRREMMSMGIVTAEMLQYFENMVSRRKERPEDDLVSHLLQDGRSELTDDEVVSTALLLMFAGNVTTINFIPVSLWAFHQHSVLEAVRADQIPLDTALEEVLRYNAIVKAVDKHAIRDLELGGREIAEGDQVFAWIGAANRDPTHFDAPDTFDPRRRPNPHLTFSTGMHFCKGAPFARLMVKVVLRTFFQEVGDIRVRTTDPDPRVRNTEYGFSELPISVTLDH